MIRRRLDSLGRVVLPQEMRSKLNLTHNTYLDIAQEGDRIIISRSNDSCSLCGNSGDLVEGFTVCRSCAREIAAKLTE